MIRSWWGRLVVLVLLVSLFVYGIVLRPRWVRQAASYAVYPVLVLQNIIIDPIKQQHNAVASVEELQETIEQLRAQHEQLFAHNVQLRATLSYLGDIQELREFQKRYHESAQIAQILVRRFSDQEQYYLIDIGSRQGIQPDMAVRYKNNLIGKIVDVYPWYSKVQLITDKQCKVAAYCERTKANGIHQGANKETCTELGLVNHLSELEEGDLVLSSGEGLVFPRGFALGTVQTCQSEDLYRKATIKPPCDLRALEYCSVLAYDAPTS